MEAWCREGEKRLKEAMRWKRTAVKPRSRLWRRAWEAYLRGRYRHVEAWRAWCGRMVVGAGKMGAIKAGRVEGRVMGEAQIILCTIASTSRLLREWEEQVGDDLNVHTVIVDECGCTAESSIGMLLRLKPRNLILVGDHKQLPPVSLCPPSMLVGTGHTRSLLERCILASGQVHRLREQYRMHPHIAQTVSKLFYSDGLVTPEA